jgi:hypothetical protein
MGYHLFGLTDIPTLFENITLNDNPNKDILGGIISHAFIDFLFFLNLLLPMCSPFKDRYSK